MMTSSNPSTPHSSQADLAGAVALVTGGSRGIGRAIALRLASLGASVAICGRDSKALQSVFGELQKLAPKVLAEVADVTRGADIDARRSGVENRGGSWTDLHPGQ